MLSHARSPPLLSTPNRGADALEPIARGISDAIVGDTPTSIRFVNQSPGVRNIIWLDYTGHRVFYNSLQPGQSYVQQTFLTHPWLITTAQGQGLAIYLPIAEPAAVFLTNSFLIAIGPKSIGEGQNLASRRSVETNF